VAFIESLGCAIRPFLLYHRGRKPGKGRTRFVGGQEINCKNCMMGVMALLVVLLVHGWQTGGVTWYMLHKHFLLLTDKLDDS